MWYYKKKEIKEIDFKKYVAFVYLITNLKSGKKYIGKKITLSITTKTIKGKKKRVKTESDWRTYYGSSDDLKKDIEELGVKNFKREILDFCENRGMSNYLEAKYQFKYAVLENQDKWYNKQIHCRIHHSHVR